MSKKTFALLSLVLVISLLFTGCNLIKIDPIKEKAEQDALKAIDDAIILAEYDGGTVTKGEVIDNYNYMVEYYNYMYSMFSGSQSYQMSDDEKLTIMQDNVAETAMGKIKLEKAKELGYDALTEEQIAEVAEQAQKEYDEYVDANVSDTLTKEQLIEQMTAEGVTVEYITGVYTDDKIVGNLQDGVTKDVTVTDDEVKAEYDELVAADQEAYTAGDMTLESYLSDEASDVYYIPEGYRAVKHILVKPADEELATKLSDLGTNVMTLTDEIENYDETAENEKTLDELNAELETAKADYATAQEEAMADASEKIAEINAKLEAGEDFVSLIAEYSDDSDSTIYVCSETTILDNDFREAAMAIANAGEYSEPVASQFGVHIIYFESEVKSGPVEFDTVKDKISEDVLNEKKADLYADLEEEWAAEKNLVYHFENWNE